MTRASLIRLYWNLFAIFLAKPRRRDDDEFVIRTRVLYDA